MADIHDEVAKLHARELLKSAERLGLQIEPVFVEAFKRGVAKTRRRICTRRMKRGKAQDERDRNRPLIK